MNPASCIDCREPITRYHHRCGSCAAVIRCADDSRRVKGWRRYEYHGVKYRSSWEVEAARIFRLCNIRFEYERRDKSSNTRPDFFFPAIGYYLEIHPDHYGPKRIIPPNCFLVKTLDDAIVSALAIALIINPSKANDYLSAIRPKRSVKLSAKSLKMSIIFTSAIESRSRQAT